MKHLKLGTYSFNIDLVELGMEIGTQKVFTRDELPDNLKHLYDIVRAEKIYDKSVFVRVLNGSVDSDAYYGGYLIQSAVGTFELNSVDGTIVRIGAVDNNQIGILINQF